jgi:predicted transcriptional regulator
VLEIWLLGLKNAIFIKDRLFYRNMFNWLFKKREIKLTEETRKSFSAVKGDIEKVGRWIKHLNSQDKQLFDSINLLKQDLSSIQEEIVAIREGIELSNLGSEDKQLLAKQGVYNKQTAVGGVEKAVQTAVQTGNFYDILRGLSSNERLLVFTLMQSEMKLSYEDLALLLGKERSTVRGQINAIKQKSEGLIEEYIEKNGKKRVFVPEEVKEKLSKYAKVRVKGKKKQEENEEKQVESERITENT